MFIRTFVTLSLLAFAIGHEVHFLPNHAYKYRYSGIVSNERGEDRDGMRFDMKVTIHQHNANRFRVNIDDFLMKYSVNESVDQTKGKEKMKSFEVEYEPDKIFFAKDDIDIWAKNIRKGLISMLEVDYRPNTTTYKKVEEGINGQCLTTYMMMNEYHQDKHEDNYDSGHEEHEHEVVHLSKQRDLYHCKRSNVHEFKAHLGNNEQCGGPERVENLHYDYILEKHEDSFVVKEVTSQEEIKVDYEGNHDFMGTVHSCNKLELISSGKDTDQDVANILGDEPVEESLEGVIGPSFPEELTKEWGVKDKENLYEKSKKNLIQFQKQLEGIFDSHLEGDISQLLWHKLNMQMNPLTVDEIVKLYDETSTGEDGTSNEDRMGLILQLLSTIGRQRSLEAAIKLYQHVQKNEAIKSKETVAYMTHFLEQFPHQIYFAEKATLDTMIKFCGEEESEHPGLSRACWLSLATIFNKMCINPSKLPGAICTKEDTKEYMEKILTATGETVESFLAGTDENLMLIIRFIKNVRTSDGLDILMSIAKNKTRNVVIRTEALAAMYSFNLVALNRTELKNLLMDITIDRSEDHGVRLNAFYLLNMGKVDKNFLLSFLRNSMKTIVNHKGHDHSPSYDENKQFLIGVSAWMREMKHFEYSSCHGKHHKQTGSHYGSHHDHHADIDWLRKQIGDEMEKYLGGNDFLNTNLKIKNSCIGTSFLMITSSNRATLPRSVFYHKMNQFASFGVHLYADTGNWMVNMFNKYMETSSDEKSELVNHIKESLEKLNPNRKVDESSRFMLSLELNGYTTNYYYMDSNEDPKNLLKNYVQSHTRMLFMHASMLLSHTESGMPIFFSAFASRLKHFRKKKAGFDSYTSQVSSTGAGSFSPFSKYALFKGKLDMKSLVLPIRITNMYAPKMGINIHLLDGNSSSRDVFMHKVTTYRRSSNCYFECLEKLEFDPIPELGYEHHTKEMGHKYLGLGAHVDIKHKVGDHDRTNLKKILKDWDPYHDLRHFCPYQVKIQITSPEKVKSFGLQVLFEKNPEIGMRTYGLTIHAGDKPSYTMKIKQVPESETPRKIKTTLTMNNHIKKRRNQVEVSVEHPKINHNFEKFWIKLSKKEWDHAIQEFNTIEHAKINGRLTFDGGEEGSTPEEIGTFEGIFGKDMDANELVAYNMMKKEKEYRGWIPWFKMWFRFLKYNIMKINVEMNENLPENSTKIFNYMEYRLFQKFKQDAHIKTEDKTDSDRKYEITVKTNREHDTWPRTDIVVKSSWGKVCYKDVHAKILPKMMPSSYSMSRKPEEAFPRWDQGICGMEGKEFTTYDSYRLQVPSKIPKCTSPILLTADCNTNSFMITYLDNHLTLIFHNSYNITLSAPDDKSPYNKLIVNGEEKTFAYGEVNRMKLLRIVRTETETGNSVYDVKFPSISLLAYENNIAIMVSPIYRGTLCGICGNFDGNWANDMVCPYGSKLSPEKMIPHWAFVKDSCIK